MTADGVTVERGAIDLQVARAALRHIWLHLRFHGIDPAEMAEWDRSTWLPWIRSHGEIVATRPFASSAWCEPQIVVRLPDEEQPWMPEYHLDEEPPWADGRDYATIYGVPLTVQNARNGSLRTVSGHIDAEPGDLIVMGPRTPHCNGLNLSAEPRVVIYHRLLQ